MRELGGTQALLLAGPECVAAGVTGRIAAILERDGLAVTTDESSNGDSRSESSRLVAVSRDAAPTVVTVTVGTEPVLRAAQRWTARNPTISVPSLIGWGATTPGSPVEGDGGNTTGTARMTEVVVLDAELSAGTSRDTIASALIDATTHAIEAWVSTRRTVMSDLCAREAWRYLASSFMRLLSSPDDLDGMSATLLGSFLASTAAEHSTLGAAHACARPVSRRYGVPHATALALLLPEVVRWNSRVVADRYAELAAVRGEARRPETLVARLEDLVSAASFPERLAAAGVVESELPTLAAEASADRVGEFNPRKFDVAGALEIYAAAY